MARLWSSGFELNSTTAAMEVTSAGTNTSVNSTIKRSGLYSWRANAISGQSDTYYEFASSDLQAPIYYRAYVRWTTFPGSTATVIWMTDASSTRRIGIQVTSGGVLQLVNDEDSVQIGSNSSALSTGVWYCLELKVDTTTLASSTAEARIDGVTFASGSANLSIGQRRLHWGISKASVTTDVYFDDIAINDASGSYQNSWPSSGKIVHLYSNGDGDTQDPTGTFADVDERPTPDDATSFLVLENNGDISEVTVEDAATQGIGNGDTITLVQVGSRQGLASAAAASWTLRIKSASGGSVASGPTVNQSVTTYNTNNGASPRNYQLTSYVDPTTGVAWTPTGTNSINNMQIGATAVDANPDINISSFWALVEYVPALPDPPQFQALGNAAGSTSGFGTLAWPTHQVGDIALLFIETTGGEPISLTTPSGFVAVPNSPQATGSGTAGTQLSVFWCRATSTSMANPVLGDSGDHQYGRIVTYRGCVATGDPFDVTAGSVKASASTSASAPSVTTTGGNSLIVTAIANDLDAATAQYSAWSNSNLINLANRSDNGTTQGNGGGIGITDGVMVNAGSTGTTTATVNSSVNASITISLISSVTRASISTLVDNFDDNSIDSVIWDNWGGGNVTETSQQLRINSGTGAGGYYGLETKSEYSLTGSSVFIRVVEAGTQAALYELTPIQLNIDANNMVHWLISNGTAYAYKVVGGSYTSISSRTHTDGDWYRIRESGGNTYWDYSTDGTNWTNLTNQANPIAVTSLTFVALTGLTSASTARVAKLDNLNVAGSSTQSLVLPHISSSSTLYAPTIHPGSVSLTLPHISSTATLYAPTLAYKVALPFISSAATLYTPTLSPGPVSLTLPHIASTSSLYAPTLHATYALTLPHIASTASLYAPSISVGAVSLTLPFISSAAVLYPPTITGANITLSLPFIPSTATLYAPTVSPGAVHLTLPHISSAATLYAPTVTAQAVHLSLPFIASVATLHPPTITTGAVSLSLPFIPSATTLYPFILRQPIRKLTESVYVGSDTNAHLIHGQPYRLETDTSSASSSVATSDHSASFSSQDNSVTISSTTPDRTIT